MPKTQTPRKPTKIVANSMFGEVQVQKSCERAAVPLAERDELRSAGLYGDDLLAVVPLSYLNVG